MLLEQDPRASRTGSLVGKKHWGQQDRRALLLSVIFCHTGQGPLRLARMAQGHVHPTTALCPRSSGQPPRTFMLPMVPCSAMHSLPGLWSWEVGSCLALWVPAPGTRGAMGLIAETGLNSLWLWLLGDR